MEIFQVASNWFDDTSILHICSNTLTEPHIAGVTRYAVSTAKELGALVSFDVNLRHNLWAEGSADISTVSELVHQAQLVKFSNEEIDYLSQGDRKRYLSACFSSGVVAILITDSAGDVFIHTGRSSLSVSPPQTKAVDTTGGGDAFIGAVLFGLSQHDDPLSYLDDAYALKPLAQFASHCGAHAVAQHGAFPAFPTFAQVEAHWTSQT